MFRLVTFCSLDDFLSRDVDASDVVISIGDPDQGEPLVLGCYLGFCREQFLDLTPQECRENDIAESACITKEQASRIAHFLLHWHKSSTEVNLVVHCALGSSRSAAIALAACSLSNLPPPAHANYANSHVVARLEAALKLRIQIPLGDCGDPSLLN